MPIVDQGWPSQLQYLRMSFSQSALGRNTGLAETLERLSLYPYLFLCEWGGWNKRFTTPNGWKGVKVCVLTTRHCPSNPSQEIIRTSRSVFGNATLGHPRYGSPLPWPWKSHGVPKRNGTTSVHHFYLPTFEYRVSQTYGSLISV